MTATATVKLTKKQLRQIIAKALCINPSDIKKLDAHMIGDELSEVFQGVVLTVKMPNPICWPMSKKRPKLRKR